MTEKKQRPETLPSFTTKVRTGYGNLYVTVTKLNNNPFEVFATISKPGRSIAVKAEAIGRLISLALRHDVPLQEIIDQLKDLTGEAQIMNGNRLIKSIPDAMAFVLEGYCGSGFLIIPKEGD
jgi:ribonucleoside-diphosphate reductase alpha chain